MTRATATATTPAPARSLTGPGLVLLADLDEDSRIAGHYRIDAVRAHLLERAGDVEQAIERYVAAAARTASIPERNYLLMKAAGLRGRAS